ncbi:helix-turn-helix domain-containing protein [Acaricomes phytoseiuli]|nr:helix-turn-helix domain-containing protein [Acaricomes phytoseiuli]
MRGRAELAKQVRPQRQALGLTQEELAAQASISLRSLVSLENGTVVPHAENLKSLAFILGLQPSTDDLDNNDEIETWLDSLGALVQAMPAERRGKIMSEIMRIAANALAEQAKSDRQRMIDHFG